MCRSKHSCRFAPADTQDTIPRGGKLLSAYKRNGQRVVVNKTGDIVVRQTLC